MIGLDHVLSAPAAGVSLASVSSGPLGVGSGSSRHWGASAGRKAELLDDSRFDRFEPGTGELGTNLLGGVAKRAFSQRSEHGRENQGGDQGDDRQDDDHFQQRIAAGASRSVDGSAYHGSLTFPC